MNRISRQLLPNKFRPRWTLSECITTNIIYFFTTQDGVEMGRIAWSRYFIGSQFEYGNICTYTLVGIDGLGDPKIFIFRL